MSESDFLTRRKLQILNQLKNRPNIKIFFEKRIKYFSPSTLKKIIRYINIFPGDIPYHIMHGILSKIINKTIIADNIPLPLERIINNPECTEKEKTMSQLIVLVIYFFFEKKIIA